MPKSAPIDHGRNGNVSRLNKQGEGSRRRAMISPLQAVIRERSSEPIKGNYVVSTASVVRNYELEK